MVSAITTKDNPYNPITDFDRWYSFDTEKGYNTCSYLARIARTADLSDEDYEREVNRAIDEICYFNLTGNYIKIVQ